MLQQRHRSQVKNNEAEISNVNMTSIHCKLQEEAEKIRKWQTSSDIEIKQKITKLKECELLISKQRNQVLEMQIENESLSTKLQKEQFNQAQINLKLKTSRELFIALKNHSENLQASIIRGEEDRDSLRMLAAETIKQIKDLKLSMQEIADTNDKQILILKSCIKDREMAYDELKFKSEQDIENALKCSEALEIEMKNCKDNIDNLSRQLLEKQGNVSLLEDKIEKLEKNLKEQEIMTASKLSALAELQTTLAQTDLSYKSAQSEILRLQKENQELNEKFGQYKADAENQIGSLQADQTKLTDSLTNLSTQFNEVTSKHDRLEDENISLKESVSQLVKCIEELQEKQEENEQEIIQLNEMYSSSVERETELKSVVQEKDEQFQNLKSTKEEVDAKLITISGDIAQKNLQEEKYLDQIEKLQSSNAEYENNLEKAIEKSSEMDSISKNLLFDLEKKTAEYIECETKSKQYEKNWKSISLSLNQKNCELKELISTNELLKLKVEEYTNKHQAFESKLDDLNQYLISLTDEHKGSCSQLNSIRTIVKDKEKELSKKDSQYLELKKENEVNKKEINVLITSTKSLEKDISCAKNLEEQAMADAKKRLLECGSLKIVNLDLEKKISKLKNDLNSAEDGSSNLSKILSAELKEATLEVTAKNDVIAKLQDNLSKLQNEQNGSLNEMKFKNEALDKENQQLNLAISHKIADISALAEEINKLQNKILKLEDTNVASKKDLSTEVNSLETKIKKLEKSKVDLTNHVSACENERLSIVSEMSNLKDKKSENERENGVLKSTNAKLLSEKSQFKIEIEQLKAQMDNVLTQNISFKNVNHKLEDKESQVRLLKQSLEEVKSDFLVSEKNYISTIDKLKEEIKKLNKNKVQAVLSNVASKSPMIKDSSESSFLSPNQKVACNPESPKTPSVGRSKKRRVAFGKSPSWHSASDDNLDEEEDTTVSSSTGNNHNKGKNLTLSKSPKLTTYSSNKSPSRLKLGKSPAPVNELLAKYPTPSITEKRGIKLPDAYVKRKEESLKKRQKIKLEACSWFDTEAAFGFDEK